MLVSTFPRAYALKVAGPLLLWMPRCVAYSWCCALHEAVRPLVHILCTPLIMQASAGKVPAGCTSSRNTRAALGICGSVSGLCKRSAPHGSPVSAVRLANAIAGSASISWGHACTDRRRRAGSWRAGAWQCASRRRLSASNGISARVKRRHAKRHCCNWQRCSGCRYFCRLARSCRPFAAQTCAHRRAWRGPERTSRSQLSACRCSSSGVSCSECEHFGCTAAAGGACVCTQEAY